VVKKKKKKHINAFTLLEMLAAVVILAVVMFVAIPKLNDVIGFSKGRTFEQTKSNVEDAAHGYFLEHPELVYFKSGKAVLYLSDLSEYIGEVVDPNGELCNGRIVITDDGESKYDFDADLTCGEGYQTDEDIVAPILNMIGDSYITLFEGDTYPTDEGVQLDLDSDGIFDSVIYATPESATLFNDQEVGTYLLVYEATDDNNNTARIFRTIVVTRDISAPTVQFSGASGVASNHNISITVTDINSANAYYQWTASEIQPLSSDANWVLLEAESLSTNPGDGVSYLHIKAIDEYDNEGITTSSMLVVDTTDPVITLTVDNNDPAAEHVINVGVEELNEDFRYYQYTDSVTPPSSEDANWVVFDTNSLTLDTGLGIYYLHVKVVDKAENEAISNSSAINIDSGAPLFDISQTTGVSSNHTVEVVNLVEPNLDKKYYMWTESSTTPSSGDAGWTEFTDDVEITAAKIGTSGDFYAHIKITDTTGNETIKSSNVLSYDNDNPVITLVPRSVLIAKTHTIDITIAESHLDSKYYVWSNSSTAPVEGDASWQSFTSDSLDTPSGLNGTWYLHVKAVDELSNVVIETSNGVELDNTVPVLNLIPDNTDIKKSHIINVVVTETNLDYQQAVWSQSSDTPAAGWENFTGEYVYGGGADGTWYLHVRVFDEVGQSDSGYISVNLDNTNPGVTFTYSPTAYTSGNVTITATGTDDNSGVYRILKPDTNYITGSSGTYVVTANGTYDFTVYDNAENSYTNSITISNIDKINPVITLNGSNPMDVDKDATYNEPGATASDNVDGNLTSSISTTGTVNTSTVGSYTITYSVTDTAGNTKTENRTVNVVQTDYTWNKYNKNWTTTGYSNRRSASGSSGSGSAPASSCYVKSSYSWSSSSGFSGSGSMSCESAGVGSSYYSVYDTGVNVKHIDSYSGGRYYYSYSKTERCDEDGYYSRGSYIEQVTDANSNAYPNDGESGSYWYVKQ